MPVTITARCHPALEPILPKPISAAKALPDWLKAMPATAVSETLSGGEVRTLKQCPPVLDAYALGVILPLACDITVAATLHGKPVPPCYADQLLDLFLHGVTP